VEGIDVSPRGGGAHPTPAGNGVAFDGREVLDAGTRDGDVVVDEECPLGPDLGRLEQGNVADRTIAEGDDVGFVRP
jgi:hypothetical protein